MTPPFRVTVKALRRVLPRVLLASAGHSMSLTLAASLLLKPPEAFAVPLGLEHSPQGVASSSGGPLWPPSLETRTGTQHAQPSPALPAIAGPGTCVMTSGHSESSGPLGAAVVIIGLVSAAASVSSLQTPMTTLSSPPVTATAILAMSPHFTEQATGAQKGHRPRTLSQQSWAWFYVTPASPPMGQGS